MNAHIIAYYYMIASRLRVEGRHEEADNTFLKVVEYGRG